MDRHDRRGSRRAGRRTDVRVACQILAALATALTTAAGTVRAQGPQVDVQGPPGALGGRSQLGQPPGALDVSSGDPGQAQGFLNARPGPGSGKIPLAQIAPGPRSNPSLPEASFRPRVLEPAELPRYGAIEIPPGPEDIGPEDGLTLDGAIERLLQKNLGLLALQYEIPMAEADVLTASLRNNPIFYADSQLVPYGHYSNTRPGGPTQYDANVTLQVDVWRKRKARTRVAQVARKAVEAQFQDAVRLTIDNLYTAYVDVVAADETLRYSQTYAKGVTRLYQVNREKLRLGIVSTAATDALRVQVEQAELQVREATQALNKATRTLALLLTMRASEAAELKVRSALADFSPLPTESEALVQTALRSRPDLIAQRLGLTRSDAEVGLARANRFSDVYLLYQPYTFQNNNYLGFKSTYSYAVGATISVPLFNRNQGNVRKAELNKRQTAVELAAIEHQVVFDVEVAVREFETSLNTARETRDEVLPSARRVLDEADRKLALGATSLGEFLEAQKDYNETVQKYRDALVRHRRSMLDLNTAVGARVLP